MAALSFAEIDAQQVELLPARTVLTALGDIYAAGSGDDGGPGGEGGPGGQGDGGDGGSADATVAHNTNNGFMQINIAVGGFGGDGGDGHGGDGGGADGGGGGDDYTYPGSE